MTIAFTVFNVIIVVIAVAGMPATNRAMKTFVVRTLDDESPGGERFRRGR